MEVYLTVDIECSEERLIRNVVRPPMGYDVMMRGRFAGNKRGLGTDLLIDEFRRFGFAATFFVEPLCAEYFGIDGLAAVCRELGDAGHDLQLHLHPNFRRPEWRKTRGQPLPDNIGEYEPAAQEQLLLSGLEILDRAGVPRASVRAFRAGNFGASNSTWLALRNIGLVVDSSLNLCYVGRSCLIDPDLPRVDLYTPVPGLWELPISCFAEGSTYRHLEITAISSLEMQMALERLRAAGASAATVLMHPAEFFVVKDHVRLRGRPNRINITRLRSLLQWLDRSRERFHVRTVGRLAHELETQGREVSVPPVQVPKGSPVLRVARLYEQAIKRLLP